MATTTKPQTLTSEGIGAALLALHIAPMSWRVSNVHKMVTEVIDGWRAFGVLTDEKVERARVLDMLVHPETLVGTDAERLDTALVIGARIAHFEMSTDFASSGGARMTYADRLTMVVADVAIKRGVFFMTTEQISAALPQIEGTRWR